MVVAAAAVALAYAVPADRPDMDSAEDAEATVPIWTVRDTTQSQRSYASRACAHYRRNAMPIRIKPVLSLRGHRDAHVRARLAVRDGDVTGPRGGR